MDDLDSLAQAAGHSSASYPAARVEYQGYSPATTQVVVNAPAPARRGGAAAPNYTGIVVGAIVLYVVGSCYALGGIFIAIGAIASGASVASSGRSPADTGAGLLGGIGGVLFGAVAVGGGLLFILAGSVAMAIRDIARNSFRH